MSERVQIVDVRPAGLRGIIVAVANADDESGRIEKTTHPLVGWAICRSVDSFGDSDPLPFVAPCWIDVDRLSIGKSDDAFCVVEPDSEVPWADLKRTALHAMTRRAKGANDGR